MYLCGSSCLASSSSNLMWFKPSLAVLKTHCQICGLSVGTHRKWKCWRGELIWLRVSWCGCWKPLQLAARIQHGLLYPVSGVFQICRLWSNHIPLQLSVPCSMRYFLAFSVILMVPLWNSSALFMFCWDCGQQYWTQYFKGGCAITKLHACCRPCSNSLLHSLCS